MICCNLTPVFSYACNIIFYLAFDDDKMRHPPPVMSFSVLPSFQPASCQYPYQVHLLGGGACQADSGLCSQPGRREMIEDTSM